jgi:hypothetical protein
VEGKRVGNERCIEGAGFKEEDGIGKGKKGDRKGKRLKGGQNKGLGGK